MNAVVLGRQAGQVVLGRQAGQVVLGRQAGRWCWPASPICTRAAAATAKADDRGPSVVSNAASLASLL